MLGRAVVLIPTVLCGVMYAAPAQADTPERYTDHFVEETASTVVRSTRRGPSGTTSSTPTTSSARCTSGRTASRCAWSSTGSSAPTTSTAVTGFTLHEHNHYVVVYDLVERTATFSGANNMMQRPGVGSVIRWTGHKVFSCDSDVPLQFSGPAIAGDVDFCRAIA